MTYKNIEDSVTTGRPYFLYAFDNGLTITRLTSDPVDLSKMSQTWLANSISHSTLEQNGNIEKASVDFIFGISDAFARTFLFPVAARITTITVWRGHHSDPDNEHRVVWKGRIVGTKSGEEKIEIAGESIFTSLRRSGCRAKYQRICRHALYFEGCNLNREDFEVPAYVTAINGLVLSVQASTSESLGEPTDYLGGMVNFNGIFGFIQDHQVGQVTLVSPIDGLAGALEEALASHEVGVPVMLAPGCRLTIDHCFTRFSNHLNFGGFPYMQDENPFSINLI